MKRVILLGVVACAACGESPLAPPAPYFDLAGVRPGDGFDFTPKDLAVDPRDLSYMGNNADLSLVDNIGPRITIVSPVAGAFVAGIITVEMDIVDNSGVDDDSVKVTLGASNNNPGVSVHMVRVKGTDHFSGLVDTRLLSPSFVLPILSAAASDKAEIGGVSMPNHNEVGHTVIVDNVGPALDIDPPANHHVEIIMAQKTACSYPFDPVGDWSVNDGDVIQQLSVIRARIEDRGNIAPGQTLEYASLIRQGSAKLYVAPQAYGALVVDSDKDPDAICDAINPALVPVPGNRNAATEVGLIQLPPNGNANFYPFPNFFGVDPVCQMLGLPAGDKDAVAKPVKICFNDLTIHLAYVTVGGMQESSIWTIPPTLNPPSPQCEGIQFDAANSNMPEGPLCAAVVAYDNAGNRNVSKAIRLCYDKGGGKCADYGLRSNGYGKEIGNGVVNLNYDRLPAEKLPDCAMACTPGVRRNIPVNGNSYREDPFGNLVSVYRQ